MKFFFNEKQSGYNNKIVTTITITINTKTEIVRTAFRKQQQL